MGTCQRSKALCESHKLRLVKSGYSFGECSPQQRAACFDAKEHLSGEVFMNCHPTFELCRAQRDYLSRKQDDWTVLTDCTATD